MYVASLISVQSEYLQEGLQPYLCAYIFHAFQSLRGPHWWWNSSVDMAVKRKGGFLSHREHLAVFPFDASTQINLKQSVQASQTNRLEQMEYYSGDLDK